MQLTTRRPPHAIRRRSALHTAAKAFAVCVAILTGASEARASDPAVPDQTHTVRPERPDAKASPIEEPTLEDTTTKRAGFEFGAYQDTDNVKVITPSINVSVENVSGGSLSASYLVDVVSAASIDIVSSASTRAGWGEVRHAGAVSGQYKPHDFGVSVGGSVSSEPDYVSYGGYAMIVKEFDDKNWTLTLGYGYSHDTAGRCGIGGACTPFDVFSRPLERGAFNGGLAWVVNRDTLASVTFDLIIENGDQSKPYRYIAMFSPTVAPTVKPGASIDFVNANRLPEKPLEALPVTRDRLAVTGGIAHRFDGSTLRVDERIYDDSWGLKASSTDVKWLIDLGEHFLVWPHVRFHVQTQTDFWQLAYVSQPAPAFTLPRYRTGDRELGPLWTIDGGFGFRWRLAHEPDAPAWRIGLTADVMYTSFLDDLYLSNRTAYLGALQLETEW
ncbi:MAG TPA: DUF3570 domain-containing protein [Polyangiaceae bacterium]|jgi:hypothetical protein